MSCWLLSPFNSCFRFPRSFVLFSHFTLQIIFQNIIIIININHYKYNTKQFKQSFKIHITKIQLKIDINKKFQLSK